MTDDRTSRRLFNGSGRVNGIYAVVSPGPPEPAAAIVEIVTRLGRSRGSELVIHHPEPPGDQGMAGEPEPGLVDPSVPR